ncbi:MAG: hypothetical protein HZA91_13605 [Verrucomicrobia bacterium]|nr:hypothetical protein [Verrucomicrobiota bacterium]
MKYDDASYHDPSGKTPLERAAAHIAIFLRWCDQHGLTSDWLHDESRGKLDRVRSGEITYTEFLLSHCCGKLTDEDLSEEGNRFAQAYYENGYLSDYSDACGFPNYTCTEAEHDYAAIAKVIDRRYGEFKGGTLRFQKKKITWQLKLRRLGFFVLGVVLPILVAIFWRSETISVFLVKVFVGMFVGIAIWLKLVDFFTARANKQSREKKST